MTHSFIHFSCILVLRFNKTINVISCFFTSFCVIPNSLRDYSYLFLTLGEYL